MKTPNGLDEIIATFGDIRKYIDTAGHLSPQWQQDMLAIAQLPFAMKISWLPALAATSRIMCHKLLVPVVEATFHDIEEANLAVKLPFYGGCFNFRTQRNAQAKLSTHSWGIALDLDPGTNAQGTPGDMDAGVVEIFEANGWLWGGRWQGKRQDPMHFQFATGY